MCLLPGQSMENGFCWRSWPGTIIKEDIPKHTQACSDEVTADVDLEDLFFVKVSISFFMKVTFLTLIEWLKGNSIMKTALVI